MPSIARPRNPDATAQEGDTFDLAGHAELQPTACIDGLERSVESLAAYPTLLKT